MDLHNRQGVPAVLPSHHGPATILQPLLKLFEGFEATMNHGVAIALQHIPFCIEFEKGLQERLFFAMALESHLAAMFKEITLTSIAID